MGLVRRQLETRESVFLDTLRRVVFDDASHPYHQMFRLARCSQEDFANLVQRDGLEPALQQIRSAGVYLSHDEFKGNASIVRDGREIRASSASFRNPLAKGTIQFVTSGSRGKAIPSYRSSQFTLQQEAMHEIVVREFGLKNRAQIVLRPTLPSPLGLQDCSIVARKGHRLEGWYTSGRSGWYRPATAALVMVARVSGCRIPFPAILSNNDFSSAAEHVARLCGDRQDVIVSAHPFALNPHNKSTAAKSEFVFICTFANRVE